jgi:acetylornithine/N-succinyldiaminopimelate aminotransferase
VTGFSRVPYNDLDAVRTVAEHNKDVVAVLVEPITGEGGIQVPDTGYLKGLRDLCDERGWLLMLDEIQTGMCRTGRWFAFEHEDIKPDVLTLAKGLGNGVPIGACLTRGPAAQVFKPGSHASTFSGNPLVCRVGLTVIDLLESGKYEKRAAELGTRIVTGLQRALQGLAGVQDIRGKGLMLAVELDRPCKEILNLALDRGLLLNVTADRVVRLLPPLILTDTEADQVVTGVADVVQTFLASGTSQAANA